MLVSLLASTVLAAAPMTVTSPGQDAAAWRTPPRAVADALSAPRIPRGTPSVSPDRAYMVLPDIPALIPLAVLAEPVEKLAGLEILPALRADRGALKRAAGGLSIVTIADGKKTRVRLPETARIDGWAWSEKGDRLAIAVFAPGGSEVWIADAATGAARRLEGLHLNTVAGVEIDWVDGDRALLCAAVPSDQAPLGASTRVPGGPQVRVGAGRPTPQRTARDVLKTEDDRARFTWYVTSQLVRIPVAGGPPVAVGSPAPLWGWSVSPDEEHLLVARLTLPAPLGFPYYLFPHAVEVWSARGDKVGTVGEAPLNDRSAISSVAPLGPRGESWSPDGQSVWFYSWTDDPAADPLKAIKDTTLAQPGTDRLMRLDAPFTGQAREVLATDHQLRGKWWLEDGSKLVLAEGYQPRRRTRWGWIDPRVANPRVTRLVDRSTEGVYDDPGRPLFRATRHGAALWTTPDGGSLWLSGDGFRADGQRPFLDRMELASGRRTRQWESDAAHLEPVLVLLAADGRRFVTSRQSNREAPNYYLRQDGKATARKLSDYVDPTPQLTSSQRIQFKFPRPDGVQLNAEVVLPADWTPGKRLPTICWVYPSDYRSAAAAQENRRAPNRFPSQSPLNPEVLVTQGYAVLYPDVAVVGTNDRYVEEIQLSAAAAIEEADRRGFCDKSRVGVGGHSYGAFSTANLLAHTDLFRAGIASDGAYNRTLTPFTFQAEERTLWEARDTYLQMSPFLNADKIREPLLLLHNLDDTNVGTHPMQSQRMYEALNGLGRTVTLVEYPYEDHAPASSEVVLDYWARVIEWYDRYVKTAAESGASTVAP